MLLLRRRLFSLSSRPLTSPFPSLFSSSFPSPFSSPFSFSFSSPFFSSFSSSSSSPSLSSPPPPSSSPSSSPSPSKPVFQPQPPRLPPSLEKPLEDILRFDEFLQAKEHLRKGRFKEAHSALWRILEVLYTAPEGVETLHLRLVVDRALAHVKQCEGEWEEELSYRTKALSRCAQIIEAFVAKDGGSLYSLENDDTRLHFQTASSALANALVFASQASSTDHEQFTYSFESFESIFPEHASLLGILAVPRDMINKEEKIKLRDLLDNMAPTPLHNIVTSPFTAMFEDEDEKEKEKKEKGDEKDDNEDKKEETLLHPIEIVDESSEEFEMKLGVGEFHMLKGDVYQHMLDLPNEAQREYKLAVEELSKHEQLGAVGLMRGGLQCPLAFALLKLGGEEQVSSALALIEHCLGFEHPALPIGLHLASIDYAKRGMIIEAEGLARTVIDKLKSYLQPDGMDILMKHYMSPAMIRTLLAHAMLHYSEFLAKTSWNGKSRASEGQYWRNELSKMSDEHPHLQGIADARWQQRPGADVWYWLWERLSISE